MIFPITIETCSQCGSFMDELGTLTIPKGKFLTRYSCSNCDHKLTVARDLDWAQT